MAAAGGEEALAYAPNPGGLVSQSKSQEAGEGELYRPPKIAPTALGGVDLDLDDDGSGLSSGAPPPSPSPSSNNPETVSKQPPQPKRRFRVASAFLFMEFGTCLSMVALMKAESRLS